MRSVSRRAALAIPAAVALGAPAVAVAAANPDAALLAMVAEHDRIEDAVDALSEPWMDVRGGAPEAVVAQVRALSRPSQALRRRIALTPAHTLAGLAAKAGVALRYLAPGETTVANAKSDGADAISVCLDLRRLFAA